MNGYKLLSIMLLSLLCMSIVSCMTQQSLPQDHYYRLPDQPGEKRAHVLFKGVLGVGVFKADGMLNDRSILTVDPEHPVEIYRSDYHLWQEVPGVLIQKNMTSYLQRVGAAGQIVLFEPGMDVDRLVSGRLLRFEVLEGKGGNEVRVHMEISVFQKENRDRVFLETYRVTIPCRDTSMVAAVEGLGESLKQIYDRFLRDAGARKLQ
ncbi:MAG: membrane integrity-associated transporter subunit PqiC [Desulfobulbaceae bacterium]|nr:membrane integrity-associated transporter subunit PqiC [Desulfobulbaceae bacterium]